MYHIYGNKAKKEEMRINLMNAACCANWNTKFNSNSKLMPFLWAIILTLYPNQNVRVSHNVQKLFQPSKSTRFYVISPLLCSYFSFSLYLYFNLLRLFVLKKTTYTQKTLMENYRIPRHNNVKNVLEQNTAYFK